VSGQYLFDEILKHADERDARAWSERLAQDGILFIADDANVGSAHPSFYHTTVHAPWYVFEHWTQWFDVIAYMPRGSTDAVDTVVLRRPAQSAPERPPVRRRASAPAADAQPTPTAQAQDRRTALGALSPPSGPLPYPSRFGALGRVARQAVFRVSRPVIMAQHQVDLDLAQSIGAIGEEVERGRRMPPVVAAALYQQAERIARVEQEHEKLRVASEPGAADADLLDADRRDGPA
jgi:hypothetical protein